MDSSKGSQKAENDTPDNLHHNNHNALSYDQDYGDEYDQAEDDDEGEELVDEDQLADDDGSDQYEAYSDQEKDFLYKKQLAEYYNKSDQDMEANIEDEEDESDMDDNELKQANHIDQLK